MTEIHAPKDKDALARVIVLIYGMLDGGKPFWVYAAVKPSRYEAFNKLKSEHKLDLSKFDEFGELIIAGEGQTPPIEVTLKVAEVYQTDPSKFFDKDKQDPTEELANL